MKAPKVLTGGAGGKSGALVVLVLVLLVVIKEPAAAGATVDHVFSSLHSFTAALAGGGR